MAFDLLEDILAFLYATGENPNPEDDVLNQEGDDEMDGIVMKYSRLF
jgi:hypothetical protein